MCGADPWDLVQAQYLEDYANRHSPRLPKPLAQTLHRLALAANAHERACFVGALFQYLATREDFSALLLCRPGQEKLGLDLNALEKHDYRGWPQGMARSLRACHAGSRAVRKGKLASYLYYLPLGLFRLLEKKV